MMNLRFVWLVSLVAMMGSLYFSEIRGFIPCSLCWYQRILMYPIPLLVGIALWRNEKAIIPYILPLSVIGIFVSLTHYLKQKLPAFNEIVPCTNGIPCNGQYINWFGFVTIPFLALVAFTLITTFLIVEIKKQKKNG